MSLTSFAVMALIGSAGMIQDPSRVRLLGPVCGKLESKAIKFDEQGRLVIDLSGLPPLTQDRRKTVCQIKVPFHEGSQSMAGIWQMDAAYNAAQGSKVLSTVRFSGVGEVGAARFWSIDDPSSRILSWKESYLLTHDSQDEDELKITWTSELQIPDSENASAPTACGPSFQWKQIVIAAPALDVPR